MLFFIVFVILLKFNNCSFNLKDYDKPQHIPDPEAKKPEDWDDEIDGEWEPPMIDNPEYKVVEVSLCFYQTMCMLYNIPSHLYTPPW